MKEEESQKSKQILYHSPSKDYLSTTPVKNAFKKCNYEIGPFLEIMNDLNRTKMRLNNVNLKKGTNEKEEDKENQIYK